MSSEVKEGVTESLRFFLGLVFSDGRPRPYVRPAFSSSASMFCRQQHKEYQNRSEFQSLSTDLSIYSVQLALIIQCLHEMMKVRRRGLIRQLRKLGNHVVEQSGVCLILLAISTIAAYRACRLAWNRVALNKSFPLDKPAFGLRSFKVANRPEADLKSGIPLCTDVPAPVTKTMRRALPTAVRTDCSSCPGEGLDRSIVCMIVALARSSGLYYR